MNIRKYILVGLAVGTLISVSGGVLASDTYRYGHQLMTSEEKAEHRQTIAPSGNGRGPRSLSA